MKKIIYLIFILVISACSWRSPNSEFYMMNSKGLSPLSDKVINVAVAKVKVPDLLDRSQMVVYDPDSHQVNILEFNRWGEVFPDVLQNTVINDLIAYMPRAYIKRTYFDSAYAQYSLNIEINNFEAYKGEKVVLSAWWNVVNSKGKIILKKQGTYTTQVAGSSIKDLVDAQIQAVHLLSKEIAEQLLKL